MTPARAFYDRLRCLFEPLTLADAMGSYGYTPVPAAPLCPRGTVCPWPALVLPPDGWAFLPGRQLVMAQRVHGIAALRDHDRLPSLADAKLPNTLDGFLAACANSPQQRLIDGRHAAEFAAEMRRRNQATLTDKAQFKWPAPKTPETPRRRWWSRR